MQRTRNNEITYRDELVEVLRSQFKQLLELGLGPLDAVLDQVREVAQRARGDATHILHTDRQRVSACMCVCVCVREREREIREHT